MKEVRRFGRARGVPELATTVVDLYDAALRPSSKTTYRTGQRAYQRFTSTLKGGRFFPFQQRYMQEAELNLAFYIAFLLLEPNITAASTILNYETHVKYKFKAEGCPETAWGTPFLKQVRKGLKNTLPSSPDRRAPLLLPSVMGSPRFTNVNSEEQRLLRFVTIIGFMGILRPHSIEQLSPDSFTMVLQSGDRIPMPADPWKFASIIQMVPTH